MTSGTSGTSGTTGHDGPGPAVPVAVVVGGGVSGLVAARELALAGARVVLLEATERLGGILARREVGGVKVDVGAESMLARRPEGTDLARQLGLGERLVHPAARQAYVWRAGTAYPLPAGTVMGVPATADQLAGLFTPAEVFDTRRAVAAAADAVEPVEEDVSVRAHIGAQLGTAVVDLLVEPLLGGVYAGRTDLLSLAATIPALWQAARQGIPVAQAVAAATATATTGSARAAHAGPVFAGLDTGMTALVEALGDDLVRRGVQLRTGTRAVGLDRLPDGPDSAVTWRVRPADGPALLADAVVVALPATQAVRLLRETAPAAAAELAGVQCASVAVVAVAVPAEQLRHVPGSGLLVPPVEARRAGLDVKAVTLSSAKWQWVAQQDPGVAVVRASLGRRGEEQSLQQDDDGLVAAAVGDLRRLLVADLTVRDAVVARWGGALPQYDVGHLARVARARAAVAELPGLGLAGAALDGVGVPACIATARQAAADALSGIRGDLVRVVDGDAPVPAADG